MQTQLLERHYEPFMVTTPKPDCAETRAKEDRALLDHARAAFVAAMEEQDARRGDNVIPRPS